MRRHVEVYAEDLRAAELGGSTGEHVDVLLPLGLGDEGTASPPPSSRQLARILPIAPPPAAAELGQIDGDRARVLDAMREGYASVLVALADPDAPTPTREAALEIARQQITDEPWCSAAEVAIDGIRIDRRRLDDEVLNVTSVTRV